MKFYYYATVKHMQIEAQREIRSKLLTGSRLRIQTLKTPNQNVPTTHPLSKFLIPLQRFPHLQTMGNTSTCCPVRHSEDKGFSTDLKLIPLRWRM
jgi:hypothetical protein